MPLNPRVLVMLPTLNERENLTPIVDEILGLNIPGLEILVIDDRSPDGTGALAERLAESRKYLTVILRNPPAGRGRAGRDGYLYALKAKADLLIEMDADGSHQPRHIRALIDAMSRCDIALGSRLTEGGSDGERTILRRWLTRISNAYARAMIGSNASDVNAGFRCFSCKALLAIDPETLRSTGPAILHETLLRAVQARLRIVEVPITFAARKHGSSKLGIFQLLKSFLLLIRLRLSILFARGSDF